MPTRTRLCCWAASFSIAFSVAVFADTSRCHAQSGTGQKAGPPRRDLLERFDQLTPAVRLQLLDRFKADKALVPVVRGDLVATVLARGSVAPAKWADLVCTVRSREKDGTASVIKWVIDDGTSVKKGDLVAQLDDSALVEELKERKLKLGMSRADLVRAREEAELAKTDGQVLLLSAEIEFRSAELAFKKHLGDDADEKEILKLHIARGRANLARAKVQVRLREEQAQAQIKAREAAVAQAMERVSDVEKQIAACRLVAPQDGIVVYYIPEQRPLRTYPLVAQGEPVREGQKLLQIPDLSQMVLLSRVPETVVSAVRAGQPVQVRVDAYPMKSLKGNVQEVGTHALQADWLKNNVKNYPVRVAILDAATGLKPGMSAEVAIDCGRAANVLRVPANAVVRSGAKVFCYTKSGQGIQKVEVRLGMRNDQEFEVKSGLNEGDQVLRDPAALLLRLDAELPPPAGKGS
jgi:RND family efflux transporter MFP subunit